MTKKKNDPFYGKEKVQKIVLHQNAVAINDLMAQLETLLPAVKQLVKSYFETPFAKEGTTLSQILGNGLNEMRQFAMTVIDSDLQIGGLKVNRECLVSSGLVQLESFPAFESALTYCMERKFPEYLQYFTIKEKEVFINEQAVEVFKDRHSILAETVEELDLYNAWEHFIQATLAFHETLEQKTGRSLLNKVDEKRLSGVINFPAWAELTRDGKIVPHSKLFGLLKGLQLKRNKNNIVEASNIDDNR